MLILQDKKIIVNCWPIFFIIFSFVLSEANTLEELAEEDGDCGKQFNKTGNFSFQIKEGCDIYKVTLEFENLSSIINVTTSIQYPLKTDETHLMQQSSNLNSIFNIKFKEFDLQEKKYFLTKEWAGNTSTLPYIYLSRSSKVLIEINTTGNKSLYKINLSFNEIPYNLIQLQPTEQTVDADYRPNSVSLLRLHEPEKEWTGIKIWFTNIKIDIEMGEYILIGTGTEPFKDEHRRPLYVTQVTENSTFFVDNPSAFVAFISGPVQKEIKQFSISWKGVEKEIEPEDPMDALKSSLICFYNYSAVAKEYEKDKNLTTFRKHFLDIARAYLAKEDEIITLDEQSIQLFGEPEMKNNTDSKVLVFLLRVVDVVKRKPICTWGQLQNLIEIFEKNSTSLLGYKVGKCPTDRFNLSKRNYYDYVIYALVPTVGLFVLMTWAWKRKLFPQTCVTEKEEKLSFGNIHAEPNAYETDTVPKMYRSDEEGRRESLIQGSSTEHREDAKGTIMVEMNAIPSTSQDILARFLSSNRKRSRPSIKSLLDNVKENKKQNHSGKTEGSESDHLYDSVSSSKQLNETKL